MKKVLIVSYSYPPANAPAAQRPYFLAKYLAQEKFSPIVVASDSSNSSLGQSKWQDEDDHIEVIRTQGVQIGFLQKSRKTQYGSDAAPKASFLKRTIGSIAKFFIEKVGPELLIPDRGLFWYSSAMKACQQIMEGPNPPEVIFSTSPSVINHIIARKLKKKYNVKWVADFRDFYFNEGVEEKKFLIRKPIDRSIEKKILTQADKVTFISKSMTENYCAKYPFIKSKAFSVYNGFDIREFTDGVQVKENKVLSIFYAGSFYKGVRSPLPLILALEYLIENDLISPEEFSVKIAGNLDISLLEEMKKYRAAQQLDLLGIIPRKKVLEKLQESHLLWLIIGDFKSHYLGFPVKGYEYIGAKRPILVFTKTPSEPEKIITELNCGTVFSNDLDNETIQQNGLKLLEYFKQFRAKDLNEPLQLPADKIVKYQRQSQAKEFEALFES